jgi:hypothetical protein
VNGRPDHRPSEAQYFARTCGRKFMPWRIGLLVNHPIHYRFEVGYINTIPPGDFVSHMICQGLNDKWRIINLYEPEFDTLDETKSFCDAKISEYGGLVVPKRLEILL